MIEHTCKILFDCNDGAAPSHKHSTVCFPIDRSGCRLCELMPQMVELLETFCGWEVSELDLPEAELLIQRFMKAKRDGKLVLRELKGIG